LDKAVQFIITRVIPIFRRGSNAAIKFFADFVDRKGTAGKIRAVLGSIAGVISRTITTILKFIRPVTSRIVPAFDALSRAAEKYGPVIQAKLTPPLQKAGEVLRRFGGYVVTLYQRYGPGIKGFFVDLGRVLLDAFRTLAPTLQTLGRNLGETLGLLGGLAGGSSGAEGAIASLVRVLARLALAVIPPLVQVLDLLERALAIPEV
jgi:hypothetical protein